MFILRIIRRFSNPTGLVLVTVLALCAGCMIGLLVSKWVGG